MNYSGYGFAYVKKNGREHDLLVRQDFTLETEDFEYVLEPVNNKLFVEKRNLDFEYGEELDQKYLLEKYYEVSERLREDCWNTLCRGEKDGCV